MIREILKQRIQSLTANQLRILHKRLYPSIKYKIERAYKLIDMPICRICKERVCTDTHHLRRREKGDCRNNYRLNLMACCNPCHISKVESDRKYKLKHYNFEIWDMVEYYPQIDKILDEIE